MAFLRRCIFAVIALAVSPALGFAQARPSPDNAAIAAARDFIKSSGAVDAMIAGMRANLPAQRQAMPQVPAEFWDRFESRLLEEAPVLADSIAMIYARTFTRGELQDITAFFRTPAGRRLVELQPRLIAETSAIGQRWGGRIGEEIAKEMMQ